MWNKPMELAGPQVTARGFEISAWTSGTMTPVQALRMWKNSPGHDNVMASLEMWADVEFIEMGCGIYQGGPGVGGFANWFVQR